MTKKTAALSRHPARGTVARIAFISAFAVCLLVCLASCTKPNKVTLSGSLPPVPLTGYQASKTPSDPKALPAVKKELAFLASLSNDKREGVISGQNVGHGDQILNPSGFFGYEPLVAELERQTGEVPGMIGLDFEHDQIFSQEQLHAAIQPLIEHERKGGMITINWAPHSPWLNDESDIKNNPGVWTDTRTLGGNGKKVNMRELVDPASPLFPVWRRKLDRIAIALAELQEAGVVVLWRPLQEMNGDWFWWGISSHKYSGDPYIKVWRDMYTYFTETKGLHNLLWVFSPAMEEKYPFGWLYPGDAYVDIVAGTKYDDQLIVPGYAELQQYNKVVAMGEFGTRTWRLGDGGGMHSLRGESDTTLFAHRLLNTYPSAAYWVSWHNWPNDDGTSEHQALVSNRNAKQLLQDPRVLTLSRLRK